MSDNEDIVSDYDDDDDDDDVELELRLREFEQRLIAVSVRADVAIARRDSAFAYLAEGPMCLLALDDDGTPIQVPLPL